jgi:hypothetical protein
MGDGSTASGSTSTTMGNFTIASGSTSTAMGQSTIASGDYSTALGYNSVASAYSSTAMGFITNASGYYSTTLGFYTTAPSAYETVTGSYNTDYTPLSILNWQATDRLFVVGNGTGPSAKSDALVILKNGKTGIGTSTPSTKLDVSGGDIRTTNQLISTLATGTSPLSVSSTTLVTNLNSDLLDGFTSGNSSGNIPVSNGSLNTNLNADLLDGIHASGFATSSHTHTGLLPSGTSGQTLRNNGSSWISNSVLYNNGTNIGIGTTSPSALLHANGTGTGEGNVLFVGSWKSTSPGAVPVSGDGTRMMWYPDKAAFRVGRVGGTHWDKDSIGNYSMAVGFNTKAKGSVAIAMGYNTTASNDASIALGYETTASGTYSTAMGYDTDASGNSSTAMGVYAKASGGQSIAMGSFTTASGENSTAMGNEATASGTYTISMGRGPTASGWSSIAIGDYCTAPSGYETAIGRYNTDYTPLGILNWQPTDRLLVVGNGTGSGSKSNAITVLKSGRIGLQTVTSPTYALELPNSSTIGIGSGRAYAWTTYSDKRIKSEIRSLAYGINEVMKLQPVSYNQHGSTEKDGKLMIDEASVPNIGFIAQDVFTLIPEIVNKPENDENALWSMSYEKLVPILVKGMQEQQQQIEDMKKIIEQQQEQIDLLLNK